MSLDTFVCPLFVFHGSMARIGMALSHGGCIQLWHFRKWSNGFPKYFSRLTFLLALSESFSFSMPLPKFCMVNFKNFRQSRVCVGLFHCDCSTIFHIFFSYFTYKYLNDKIFPLILGIFQICYHSQHAFVPSGHAPGWMTYQWWESKGEMPQSTTR